MSARLASILTTIWLAAAAAACCEQAIAAPPNVIVLLADDAGLGDYGFSGNENVATPNIDAIAARGVSLERFFVCPVCAPTRAEFLTGRYHPRTGVSGVSTGFERLNLDEATFVQSFQKAGYATGAFGKWHNGSQWPYHPMARGFDEYFGHSSGHWGEYFDAPLEDNGRMVRTSGYIVDVCTTRAIDFIERNKDRPFFCYVPFTTPHSPWAAPESDWRRWKDRSIEQTAEDRRAERNPENFDETRCVMAMIENQDANVGRLLAKLDELDLSANTIVVYFSDNGPNTRRWNRGLKGIKGSVDEGGVRSVCFVRWPARLPPGRSVRPICAGIDLAPTLLSLAGLASAEARVGEKPFDGRDLTPLLVGEQVDWPDRTLFSTWAGRVSARTDRWRLDEGGRLYDMGDNESQSQVANDLQPEVAEQLQAEVDRWRSEVFDETLPAGRQGVDPRPFPVGYREFPITLLPARDATPHGGVKRSSPAPNCSYFVNWRSTDDRLVWKVDVQTAGEYDVVIDYTCARGDAGSLVELSLGEQRLAGRVTPEWDPPLYTNQDTLPRPHGESSMKEFRPLRLGTIELPAGEGELILRAVEIPGKSVMDLRRLTLTLAPGGN